MRIIPVIDLLNGQVVRGIAGRRDEYRPIQSQIAADSSPRSIATALVEQFGFDTVYVADLDAITRGQPDIDSWGEIAACGLTIWLDAGVADAATAAAIAGQAQARAQEFRLVIGLESLTAAAELPRICGQTSAAIFSLDLKAGQPQTKLPAWQHLSPLALAAQARDAGYRDLIVLDLADVGAGGGTRTLDLCRQIRQRCDFKNIIAGGGVRGIADLQALSSAGCSAALVASALHDGRLTLGDLRRFAEPTRN